MKLLTSLRGAYNSIRTSVSDHRILYNIQHLPAYVTKWSFWSGRLRIATNWQNRIFGNRQQRASSWARLCLTTSSTKSVSTSPRRATSTLLLFTSSSMPSRSYPPSNREQRPNKTWLTILTGQPSRTHPSIVTASSSSTASSLNFRTSSRNTSIASSVPSRSKGRM